MAPLGIVTPIPWAVPIFQALPTPDGLKQWIDFCDDQIDARKKVFPRSYILKVKYSLKLVV
jgi:hypothetical protein